MSPFHVGQLSAFLIIKVLIVDLLLLVLFNVEAIGFYDWDVGCWADVVGAAMHLLICAFFGASDLEKSEQGKGLEDAAAHSIIFINFVKIYQT